MQEDEPSSSMSEPSGSSGRERELELEHTNGAQASMRGDREGAAGAVDERRGPKENPYSDIREEDAADKEPGIMDKVVFLSSREPLASASTHGYTYCDSQQRNESMLETGVLQTGAVDGRRTRSLSSDTGR